MLKISMTLTIEDCDCDKTKTGHMKQLKVMVEVVKLKASNEVPRVQQPNGC